MVMMRNQIMEAYGMGDNLIPVFPAPIVAQRAPTSRDVAEIGSTWVDVPNDAVYVLTSITAGAASWQTSPASGSGVFTAVTVNPGDIDVTAGDINIDAGNLSVTAGNALIGGDLQVNGTLTFTGDLDLTSASLIDLTSTANLDPSVLIRTNGGTTETIQISNLQGTSVDSVDINSVAGGITLSSNLATADGMNINANGGGIDMDAALQINIASSRNAADAIVINASAGGMDLTAAGAAGEDIDIVNTAGSININSGEVIANSMVLTSAGGLDITVAGTGALDIDMSNAAGSINISAAEAAADAIVINASDAAGGVQIQAGSNGILIGNQADCAVIDVGDVVPTSARTVTVSGGAVATAIADTLDLAPDGATTDAGASKVVNINSGALDTATLTTNIGSGNVASGTHAVNVSSGTGTKTVNIGNADGLTTINIDAIALINDSLNVNTSINTGTSTGAVAIGNAAAGAITLDTAAGISLDGATASNFTVTGASADLTLSSVGGSVNISGSEAAADAIVINASDAAGGVEIQAGSAGIFIGNQADCAVIDIGDIVPTSARSINIGGGAVATAIADTIDIGPDGATTDAGASKVVNINSGALDTATLTTNIGSGNVASGTHAVNISTGTGTKSVTIGNADVSTTINAIGPVNVNASHNANTAINSGTSTGTVTIGNAAAGAIAVDTAAGISLDAATASNFTVTGASADLTLAATGGSVNVTATEAAADAIVLNASNAAGGIDLLTGGGEITINSGGNVAMTPATATAASPTATVVINNRVGVATFTGFTTASSGTQTYTITNSALGAGDGVFVTISNRGSNDAQISLRRVNTETAGSLVINTVNNGAAALNGDVVICFWVIN